MKKIIFMIFLISASMPGQELQNILPQSPEAASIGRYGQVPVGLFTGTPQLNIPIHQFSSGALTLPIGLNYSSNGIRVDEYASSVGLGWNLSAGGVITRSVYGQKDENQYLPASSVNLDVGADQFQFVTTATSPGNDAVDIQPDIFSFSFNGYSGKFYLDDNSTSMYTRDVVFLAPSPLKVELLQVNLETHFKITDPTGIIYYFGGLNAIEKFRYRATNQSGNSEGPEPVASAWYLTKMTHPSGEEIDFLYTKGDVNYANGISQSISKENSITNYGEAPRFCNIPSSEKAYLNIATGNFSYLTEISSTTTGKITFEYAQKAFMPTGFKQLDHITIHNYQDELIKSFDLGYQITDSNGPSNLDIYTRPHHSKRYFLSSVTDVSKTGNKQPPHTFTYTDPESLPSRFSYAQDYWGFYNGKDLNENLIDQKTIDAVSNNYILYNALSSFKAADRSPNPSQANKGILQRIIYPLKGSNEFIYEGNAYYDEVKKYPPIAVRTADVSQNSLITNSFEIQNVDFTHKGFLSFKANLDDFFVADGETFNPVDFNIANIEVYDTTSGATQPVYAESDIHSTHPFMTPYGINNNNFSNSMYVKLEKGHEYRFDIRLIDGYSLSGVTLRYYDAPLIITQENIPVGGMRIKQVNTLSGNGKTETKKYHYGTMDCMGCDSGSIFNRNLKPTIIDSRILFCRTNSSGTVGNNNSGNGGVSGEGPNSEGDGNSSGGSSGGNSGGSGSDSGDNSGGSGDSSGGNSEGDGNSSGDSSGGSGNNSGDGSNVIITTGPDGSLICSNTGECGYTTITSNTLFSLYAQGYHIGYSNVIEELGNNFKGGAVHHQFEGSFQIEPGLTFQGDPISGIPNSNFFGFGRNKGTTLYVKTGNQFKKVSETKNEYTQNTVLDKNTNIYVVRREAEMKEGFSFAETEHFTFQNRLFAIAQYNLKRQWHVLDKKITKQYDTNGENPLTTTVSYFYDNEQHLQQTRTETIDSNGHILKTKTRYPQDIANPLPIHQQMISNHQIAVPVQVENYRKEGVAEELISSQHTLFKDWGNNLILPEAIQTLKGAQSATNTLEDRIEYLDYDTKGNPLEVSKTDGSHILYIWGYQDQYPIAKITNASYIGMPVAVTNLINQIKTATNTENSNVEESTIRGLFDNLRDHDYFKASEITSYTYDPLIGATSVTDPRGYTMTYHYDKFNRLEFVKDENGKLISENKYYYKN